MQSKNAKDITIFYLKKEKRMNIVSKQTKTIRENTNEKIRQLGNKYFLIKRLFEQLNLHRDDLFLYAKDLAEKYKNIKNGIYIKNYIRRMKDAIYCWYAEYFFDEIYIPDSLLLKDLIQNTNHTNNTNNAKYLTNKFVSETSHKIKEGIKENLNFTNGNKKDSAFQPITINQEIDTLQFSNIQLNSTNANGDNDKSNNIIFDFDSLFKI